MTTSIMSAIDAKEQLADLINRVSHNKDRIVLTRRGKDVAVLISMEDLTTLLAAQDKQDLQDATNALTEARQLGIKTLEQLKTDIGA